MSMRVLISGICGFVGASLAEMLVEHFDQANWTVVGFDNFSRAGGWRNIERLKRLGVELLHADVRRPSDLELVERCDWIIDAAANPTVLAGVDGRSSTRGLVETNLLGTVNLLELCKGWQAGLILLSTSRVYSLQKLCELPFGETDSRYVLEESHGLPIGVSCHGVDESFATTAPVSLYGATKLASEQLAAEYGLAFRFPVWINRCGVMAGAGQFARADQGIFAYWLHSWQSRRPLKYLGFGGRGLQVRDCLHPRDLGRLLVRQIQADIAERPTIVNVSGGLDSARSLAELSHWCQGRWGDHMVGSLPAERPFDVPWMVLDARLAKSVWGWRPEWTTDTILAEIAEFAERHPGWLEMTL